MPKDAFKKSALVLAIGALPASAGKGAPILYIDVLGSTSGNAGTFSNSLSGLTSSEQIYIEMIARFAPIGTVNNGVAVTSDTSLDGLSTQNFGLSSSSGTVLSSPALSATFSGNGAMTGTASDNSITGAYASNSGPTGSYSVGVVETADLTVGSGTESVIAVISGAGGISFNNGTKHTFTGTGTTAGKQGSSDPYLGLTQLTLDPSSLTWDGGGGNGNWDINTTANFSGHQYTDGSVVTFGDTSATGGSVSNTNPITIASGGVQPSSVTFTNLTAIYKFQTSGTIGIGGDGSVSITGGGTVILSSPNIYSAGTFITSGTLKAASGSLNSTGAVTIGASGKLYVGDGSSSAGTLSTGAQTWTAGGCYLPKVSGDGTADLLTIGTSVDPVGGTLTLNGTGAFDIVPQVGAVALGQTSEHWELAAFNSTITGYTGTLPSATGVANGAGVNSQFALNTSALSEPGADFSLSLVELPSGDDALYLNYTGTPEPSTGMLIIAGGATMLHRRRRK